MLGKQLERWRETRELREFARELADRITAAEQALTRREDAARLSVEGDGVEENGADPGYGEEDATVEPDERAGQLADARAWLAWVQGRAAARDPLDPLPGMPPQRRLREWDLTKFMRPVPPPRPGDY